MHPDGHGIVNRGFFVYVVYRNYLKEDITWCTAGTKTCASGIQSMHDVSSSEFILWGVPQMMVGGPDPQAGPPGPPGTVPEKVAVRVKATVSFLIFLLQVLIWCRVSAIGYIPSVISPLTYRKCTACWESSDHHDNQAGLGAVCHTNNPPSLLPH